MTTIVRCDWFDGCDEESEDPDDWYRGESIDLCSQHQETMEEMVERGYDPRSGELSMQHSYLNTDMECANVWSEVTEDHIEIAHSNEDEPLQIRITINSSTVVFYEQGEDNEVRVLDIDEGTKGPHTIVDLEGEAHLRKTISQ